MEAVPVGGGSPLPPPEKKDNLDLYLRNVAKGLTGSLQTSLVQQGSGPIVREEGLDADEIVFDSEIYGVKMNAAGDWLVTLKVPYRDREAITSLSGVTGLNMKTRMVSSGLAT